MNKRLLHNILGLMLVVLVCCVFYFYDSVKPEQKTSLETKKTVQNDSSASQNTNQDKAQKSCNPNTANLEELLQAGFTKKQAYNCLNYRKSGGSFTYKQDILKLYTIQNTDYNSLQKFILLPNKTSDFFTGKQSKKQKQKIQIDINSADTIALQKLPNIGAFRARKIVEYRQKLGGFYQLQQLLQVYSVDSAVYFAIKNHCFVDTNRIKKININSCSFKELQSHPCGSYQIAKKIFEYRKIVGVITEKHDLLTNHIIEIQKYTLLKHYIKTF